MTTFTTAEGPKEVKGFSWSVFTFHGCFPFWASWTEKITCWMGGFCVFMPCLYGLPQKHKNPAHPKHDLIWAAQHVCPAAPPGCCPALNVASSSQLFISGKMEHGGGVLLKILRSTPLSGSPSTMVAGTAARAPPPPPPPPSAARPVESRDTVKLVNPFDDSCNNHPLRSKNARSRHLCPGTDWLNASLIVVQPIQGDKCTLGLHFVDFF